MKNFRLHEQKFQPALCHEVLGLESSGFMTSKEQAQTCPTDENTFRMKILVTRTKLILRLAAWAASQAENQMANQMALPRLLEMPGCGAASGRAHGRSSIHPSPRRTARRNA